MQCRLIEPKDGESPVLLEITIDEARLGRTAFDVCRRLREGSPPIYVGHGKLPSGLLVIHPACLREEHVEPLARRLVEELS